MFWGFKVRDEIKTRFTREIAAGTPLVIRDEKTMSGRVHVGSLRGVAIHGLVSELLSDAGIANRFLFEINDYDPMDGLPIYVDQKRYAPFMGRLLCDVPSPDDSAANYADYFAKEFTAIINRSGFVPELYRSSTLYREGKYNDCIRLALEHADRIREIYKQVSGSVKDADWYPLQVVCETCGKIGTTKVTGWDGSQVTYECRTDLVKWAVGCGHAGSVDPFDGRAKLPWKVEWAAKFKILGVHIEGAGKDHSTKGGARDVSRHIVKEVFDYPEPYNIPYGFLNIAGKKMSSSKGLGATAKEISDLLPPHILRLLLSREPRKEIDFDPQGDTMPILYDAYDGIAAAYFEKRETELTPVFPYFHLPSDRAKLKAHFLPRFSLIAYLSQMPHISLDNAVEEMKGAPLTEEDRAAMNERSTYATVWLNGYSPEKYRLELQKTMPVAVSAFTDMQRAALRDILVFIQQHPTVKGEDLHTYIHEVKKQKEIAPDQLFSAIYVSFLGKNSGPQAGWFLSALPRDFVLKRLTEVAS